MTITFHNPGLLDLRAFTTFGVNAKESASAIGYFGTGLKYAVAVLLREGCEITGYVGDIELRFRKSEGKFRGKDFQFVSMSVNGEETQLPFTLELGKNWELWMAYRELYTNALDEGGSVCQGDIDAKPGHTYICVNGDAFEAVHRDRAKWFIQPERKPFIVTDDLDVYEGETYSIFNKGICVKKDSFKLFTYNVKRKIDLSEDRHAIFNFQLAETVKECLVQSNNAHFIQTLLTAPNNVWEHEFNFGDVYIEPSETFLKVYDDLIAKGVSGVKQSIRAYVMKQTGRDCLTPDMMVEIDEFEQMMLNKAKDFVASLGLDMEKYPIVVIKNKEQVCGSAYKGTIYINKDTFRRGTLWVAATLFEEYTHLDTGYEDETYDLQTHYLMRMLDYAQRWKGVTL